MQIYVISSDATLRNLSREVLDELDSEASHELFCVKQLPELHGSAVVLYDLDLPDPSGLSEDEIWKPWTGVVVSARTMHQLERFRKRHFTPFLMKPVERQALYAFFSNAIQLLEGASQNWCSTKFRDENITYGDALAHVSEINRGLLESHFQRVDFLSRFLHDFRAPLTALQGYCALLNHEQVGLLNQTQKEVLQQMDRAGKRLERMSESLFRLVQGESLEPRLDMRLGDIESCIRDTIGLLKPQFDSRNINVSFCFSPPGRAFEFDENEIGIVLANLLENALKFTPRHGSITVQAMPSFWERRRQPRRASYRGGERRRNPDRQPNIFRVDVCDTGPGIPSGHERSIFDPYVSLHRDPAYKGTGLGLATCRMIVEAHGGNIFAKSTDSGAEFSVFLPLNIPGMASE